MFGSKPKPVAEHEARGDTARIYHEIRQTLRVSGVNLNFRTWAGFPQFFPSMWEAMQPIAASQAFEWGADAIRARAADLGAELPPLDIRAKTRRSSGPEVRHDLACRCQPEDVTRRSGVCARVVPGRRRVRDDVGQPALRGAHEDRADDDRACRLRRGVRRVLRHGR
jgi:hypothetical protein